MLFLSLNYFQLIMYNPKLNSAKSGFEYLNDMQNTGLVKTAKLLAKLYAGMSDGGITEAGGTSATFNSTF